MKKYKISVRTKNNKYSIVIGKNLIDNFSKILVKEKIYFNKCLIVVDKNIPKKFLLKLKKNLKKNKIFVTYFVSNEKNKNYNSVNKILSFLFKNNFSREDCLISLGGGITGDVSGFAASIFKRGIKFINIPTTLLAQVDSSIGGKTGINNLYGKNLIGSFYQPALVISDILFLKYLNKREIICGYGEILKHSLIANKKYFLFLDKFKKKIIQLKSPYIEKAIFESCSIKKLVVQKDEKEKNIRKVLNFGHTFAHAYESAMKYSKKLNHGEAVIIGIKSAVQFSYKNNFLSKRYFEKITNHINDLNHKLNFRNFFKKKNIKSIVNFMKMDKKNNSSKINIIILKKIGKPLINFTFSEKKIKSFLTKI